MLSVFRPKLADKTDVCKEIAAYFLTHHRKQTEKAKKIINGNGKQQETENETCRLFNSTTVKSDVHQRLNSDYSNINKSQVAAQQTMHKLYCNVVSSGKKLYSDKQCKKNRANTNNRRQQAYRTRQVIKKRLQKLEEGIIFYTKNTWK